MNNLMQIILLVLVAFMLLNYSCGKSTENFAKGRKKKISRKKCKNLGRKFKKGKCTNKCLKKNFKFNKNKKKCLKVNKKKKSKTKSSKNKKNKKNKKQIDDLTKLLIEMGNKYIDATELGNEKGDSCNHKTSFKKTDPRSTKKGDCKKGLVCQCSEDNRIDCNEDAFWECYDTKEKSRGLYDPCIPGNNNCKDGLFCSSYNEKYIQNREFSRCMKKHGNYLDFCNPSYEEGIKNAEQSCIDGSCRADEYGDYTCQT